MADKKEYTPQEVAEAILKKCQDLIAESKLAKANTAHEIEGGSEASNSEAECPEQLTAGEVAKEGDQEKKKKKIGGSEEDLEEADEDMDGDVDGDDALAEADKDDDGDIDGSDALAEESEEKEEESEDKKKEKKAPFEKKEDMDKCGDMKAIGKNDKLKGFLDKRKKKVKN